MAEAGGMCGQGDGRGTRPLVSGTFSPHGSAKKPATEHDTRDEGVSGRGESHLLDVSRPRTVLDLLLEAWREGRDMGRVASLREVEDQSEVRDR